MATYHATRRFSRDLMSKAELTRATAPDMTISETDDIYWRLWVIEAQYKLRTLIGMEAAQERLNSIAAEPQKVCYQAITAVIEMETARIEQEAEEIDCTPLGGW